MPTPIQWIPFDDRQRARIRRGQHAFTGRIRRMPWPYCAHCGLLLLKNDSTRAAARQPCVSVEDE